MELRLCRVRSGPGGEPAAPLYARYRKACPRAVRGMHIAMKYVVAYESAPDFRSKVPIHIEAHRALWKRFQGDGTLLMIGPFTDEPAGGAMGIFTTREAAEAFVAADPFVQHGLVARFTIREWNEVLA